MKHLRLFLVAVATVFGLGVHAQVDITDEYLRNANLSSLDGWSYGDTKVSTKTDGVSSEDNSLYLYQQWRSAETDAMTPAIEFYHAWSGNAGASIGQTQNFHFTQTVTLPAGNYRIAVNAFYREGNNGGVNNDKAWIFAGERKQNVLALTPSDLNSYSGDDMDKARAMFKAGKYANAFDFDLEEETEIELGFRGFIDTYCSWCILGPVKLFKYSLEDYLVDYRALVAEATALYDSPMNASVLNELKAAVVDESSFHLVKEVTAAIQELTQKITQAKNSIAVYEEAKAIIDAANGYDSYGQDSYNSNETVAAIKAAYEAKNLETLTSDQKAAAAAALATACKAQQQPADGCDMSAYIVNPSFDGGSFTGWSKEITVNGNNQAFNNTAYEYWSYTAGSGGFDYYQVINDLPEGVYSISADMYNDQVQKEGDTFAPAAGVYGSSSTESVIKLVDVQGATFNTYTTDGLTVLDGTLRIGAKNETEVMPARWFVVDNFKLTYVRQLTEEEKAAIIKESYDEVLTAAKEAYESGVNAQAGEEGVALNNEIKKAEPTTVEGYKAAIQALTSATEVFNAAVPAYDAYAAEKAIAEKIGVEVDEAPTTAAEASAKVNELKVAEFNYINEEYPYDYTPVIGDFGTWTGTATVNEQPAEPRYLTGEHWSGDKSRAYYEQAGNGWSSNAWTVQYQKTAKLPAGDYMLKVAARASVDVSSYVKCSATDFTVALPNAGNATKGIDKSGDANFGDGEFVNNGNGFGWEWRFLPFSLTEETEVTMTFYGETNKQYNWMSISDGTLLSKQEIVNVVELKSTDATVVDATVASEVNTDRKLLKGLNTIILPFDVTAEEIGAATILEYKGTSVENDVTTLNFKEVAPVDGKITLQPNVPYAVFVDADQEEALSFGKKNIAPSEDLTTEDANGLFDFVGTFIDLVKGNDVIVKGDLVAGEKEFKKAKGGNRIAAYRAYLKKIGEAEPANIAFNFNGEIVTGIEAVEILNRMSGDIYNINGQKVSRTQKGIYIINGQKVIVK